MAKSMIRHFRPNRRDHLADRVFALESALSDLTRDVQYLLTHIDPDNMTEDGIRALEAVLTRVREVSENEA